MKRRSIQRLCAWAVFDVTDQLADAYNRFKRDGGMTDRKA
jgi:hypothetical protein